MARPKKTVTLFETKPLDAPIVNGTIPTEEYEVIVEAPKGLPLPYEGIKSTKFVPGGILWTPFAFQKDPSFLSDDTDKVALCLSIIFEIDKGQKGFFNDAYFMNCDKLTPGLKQFEFFKEQFLRIWKKETPPTEEVLIAQFGNQMRAYLRAIAFRFFSYYHMGYKIIFKKMESKVAPSVEITPPTEEKKEATASN